MIRRLALAAALLAQPLAAAAQPPAPARAAPRWQVDWGHYYCSLIRKSEAGRPFSTAFVTSAGGTGMGITLVPDAGQQAPSDVDTITLLPAGTSYPVSSRDERHPRGTLERITRLPDGFRELLAAATELQLKSGSRLRARVPLDGLGGALVALRQCLSGVAREWGIDEAALAALTRRPATTNTYGITPDDYPPQALRQATQGLVVMRIAVSAEGRATACAVVATSGSPEIDQVACRIALRRGLFTPALDAAGRPVAIQAPFTIFFRLPDF